MLPGETRTITVETAKKDMPAGPCRLVVKGFNADPVEITVKSSAQAE